MTKTVREGFAERFKQALEEAGLAGKTQKDLGKLFQITPQGVRKWLAGEAMPASERAPVVARILGVRKAWLIDDELPVRALAVSARESGNSYTANEGQLSISGEEYLLITRFRLLSQPVKGSLVNLLAALQDNTGKQ